MLKVLLVDDELLMRSMIRSILDFDSFGYHICGECPDGQAAIRLIEDLNPDIVITDIKMGRMDGDYLVEYISQSYPEIKVIVLSNYDDYKYVRNTMRNHAVDYLIKNSLTKEALLESLEKARCLLAEKPDIVRTSVNVGALTDRFLVNLVSGFYKKNKGIMEREIKRLGVSFSSSRMVVAIMVIKDYCSKIASQPIETQRTMEFSIGNIVNEILNQDKRGLACHLKNEKFVLVLSVPDLSEVDCGELIKRILSRISFCLKKYMNLFVRYSVGPMRGIQTVDESYTMAERQAARTYSFRENDISFYDYVYEASEANEKEKIRLEDCAREELIREIELMDWSQMLSTLRRLFNDLGKEKYSQVECMTFFDDLLTLLMLTCRQKGIAQDSVCEGESLLSEYLVSQESFENCCRFFERTYGKLAAFLVDAESKKDIPQKVQQAAAIMKRRFRDAVSLSEVAEELGIHPSYLSTIFKNAMGKGYAEYLTVLRLEEAERMLTERNCKPKEAAILSGFPNSHAFIRAYRKKHGTDPKNIRK